MSDPEFDIKEFTRTEVRDESRQRRALMWALNGLVLCIAILMSYLPLFVLLTTSGRITGWGAVLFACLYSTSVTLLFAVYHKRKHRWTKMQVTFTRKTHL